VWSGCGPHFMFTPLYALPVLCHRTASRLGPSRGNDVSLSIIFAFLPSIFVLLATDVGLSATDHQ
jgi:hypothetical protein